MDAFKRKVTWWYIRCQKKGCTCATKAHNSAAKKRARRLARVRLKNERVDEEDAGTVTT